jgi:nucleoside-diphosphate-sugar epimerase
MTTPQTNLHVVLGAGPAGTALASELARRGLPVRHVARSPIAAGDGAAARLETRQADVSTTDAAIAATEGAAVIYHAVNVAYHLQIELMPAIGTSILAAAEKHGAKLVVLDTLYPYGEADGEHITESTPWAATSRKGKLRAELDQQYLEAHRSGAVSTVLGRSADFFGPRVLNSTLGAAFFPGALTGGPALALGDIALPHSYTYIRDVASGLATLGTTGHGDGRVWHLPTAPATTTATIHALVEELVGQPLTVHLLSDPKPYGPFDEQFMAEYAEMFYQHRIPQNMVSAAFEETFGVAPTPLRHALSATVDWYREFLSQR